MLKAKLVVVGGDAKAAEIALKLPTIIGRAREAALTLPHPLVSRQHCEIFEEDGLLHVRDLKSLNGTYVNSQRIESSAPLEPNQLLTIGNVTFRAIYSVNGDQEFEPGSSVRDDDQADNFQEITAGDTDGGAFETDDPDSDDSVFNRKTVPRKSVDNSESNADLPLQTISASAFAKEKLAKENNPIEKKGGPVSSSDVLDEVDLQEGAQHSIVAAMRDVGFEADEQVDAGEFREQLNGIGISEPSRIDQLQDFVSDGKQVESVEVDSIDLDQPIQERVNSNDSDLDNLGSFIRKLPR